MSMAAFKWAKKQKNLSHPQKSVLICIADFLNEEKGFAWPSQKTIASETSLHRATVHRACIGLYKKGLITWTKSKKGNGTFSSNKYVINHVAQCNRNT
jgi:DNA-binding MarR family transcriptional regulator